MGKSLKIGSLVVVVVAIVVTSAIFGGLGWFSKKNNPVIEHFSVESLLPDYDLVLSNESLLKNIMKNRGDTFSRQIPYGLKNRNIKNIHFILSGVPQKQIIVSSASGEAIQSVTYQYDQKDSKLILEIFVSNDTLSHGLDQKSRMLDGVFGMNLCLASDKSVSQETATPCVENYRSYFGNLDTPLFILEKRK